MSQHCPRTKGLDPGLLSSYSTFSTVVYKHRPSKNYRNTIHIVLYLVSFHLPIHLDSHFIFVCVEQSHFFLLLFVI